MKSPNSFFSLAGFFSRLVPIPIKQAIYRLPFLARWVRSGLNRAAPAGLSTIEISGGTLTGMRMALDLHKEKSYWLGTYEVALQAAVADLVKPGVIAYDIGANIGYVTLMLARAVEVTGKVFAFEALPDNFERLKHNIALNGMENRVETRHCAVVDGERAVNFWPGPSGAMGKAEGSAGRADVSYSQSLTVPGISLDSFVYDLVNPLPQVVKMDIEGGEVMALPGMRRILTEAQPIMLLELHGPEAARISWDILSGMGYRICRMEASFPVVTSLEVLDWKAYLVGMKP